VRRALDGLAKIYKITEVCFRPCPKSSDSLFFCVERSEVLVSFVRATAPSKDRLPAAFWGLANSTIRGRLSIYIILDLRRQTKVVQPIVRFVAIPVVDQFIWEVPMYEKPHEPVSQVSFPTEPDVDVTLGVLGRASFPTCIEAVEPGVSGSVEPCEDSTLRVIVEDCFHVGLGDHHSDTFLQIGSAARLALESMKRAKETASGGDQRPEQILRDAPKSAGARGPVDDVPTVGRPAIVAKDAERE